MRLNLLRMDQAPRQILDFAFTLTEDDDYFTSRSAATRRRHRIEEQLEEAEEMWSRIFTRLQVRLR